MSVPAAGDRSEDLDDRIRLAAPVQDSDLDDAAVRTAVSGVALMVVTASRAAVSVSGADVSPVLAVRHPTARRRRRLMGLSVVSTVWVLSATGAAAAAAGGYALYSGFFDSVRSTESVQAEEYVNVGSPDFGPAFDRIAAEHPLPPSASYDQLYGNIVDTGGLMQLSGTAGQVVLHSVCAWSAEWVRAEEANDSQATRDAVAMLEAAASSPDLAAIDGGGVVDNVTALSQAAASADTATLTTYVGGANCTALSR